MRPAASTTLWTARSTATGSRTSPSTKRCDRAARLLEGGDELVGGLARAVEAGDPGSLAGEELRDLLADAAAGTRHECDSVFEQHARLPFSLDAGGSRSSIAHMDEAVATNAPWEIMGARHGGITVSDLDRSLEFYVGLVGLELVWRREYVNDEIREIVGIPDATSVDIAMLDIPGGGAQVELLEYKGCERKSGSTPPSRLRHRPLLRVRAQHRGVSCRARRAGRPVPL